MNADELRARFSRAPVKVNVDGETLYLLPLCRRDMRDIRALSDDEQKLALAFVRSVCTESGGRVFTDEQAGELDEKFQLRFTDAVQVEINKLNGFGQDAGKVPSPETPS